MRRAALWPIGFFFLLLMAGCQVTTGSRPEGETGQGQPSGSSSATKLVAEPSAAASVTEPTAATETALVTPEPIMTPGSTTMNAISANADVEFVRAVQAADGSWTFHVTVRHPDTGWEDYADGWDVVTPDGIVLKQNAADLFTRLLLHPHDNEQPFTRSQSEIIIPETLTQVTVRAHDLVDGYGGREVVVDLTVAEGPNIEVVRNSFD